MDVDVLSYVASRCEVSGGEKQGNSLREARRRVQPRRASAAVDPREAPERRGRVTHLRTNPDTVPVEVGNSTCARRTAGPQPWSALVVHACVVWLQAPHPCMHCMFSALPSWPVMTRPSTPSQRPEKE